MKNTVKRVKIAVSAILAAAMLATLVACHKQEPARYSVYFETNGGTAINSYSLTEGEAISRPADPSRNFYVFDNWYADEARTQVFAFGSGMPEHDVTVYANWTPDSVITITYDANGGAFDGGATQATGLCKLGDAFTAIDELPTRAGYVFSGWYTAVQGGVEYDGNSYPIENTTLYARWGKSSAYAYVTYYGNGNKLGEVPVKKGETVKPYSFGSGIVSADYYTDAALTQKYTFAAASSDITLYTVFYTDGLKIEDGVVTGYDGKSSTVYVPSSHNGKPVTSIGTRAFYRSSEYADNLGRITRVVLPDTVVSLAEGAFYDCRYLASVNLTDNIRTIGANAFWHNERLAELGNISGVTSIGDGAFTGCKLLRSVNLSANLNSIGANAFADCVELREITIPSGVRNIGAYTFYGCKNLTTVVLQSDRLVILEGAREGDVRVSPFNGCAATLEIRVPAALVGSYKTSYEQMDNGTLANKFTSIR